MRRHQHPFPTGFCTPTGSSAGLQTNLGQSLFLVDRNHKILYTESWNFDIQRKLPLNMLFEIAYTGNRGIHLPGVTSIDQLAPQYQSLGSQLNSPVPNPFYGVITDYTSTLSLPTVQYGQLLRPFPQFLNVKGVNVGAGHSSYHASQLTVERRFAQGLAVLLGFTYSKAIDSVGEMTSVAGTRNGPQDDYCLACDRARSDQNEPYAMRMAVRYDLPFGRSRRFVTSGIAARVLGGWSLGAFATIDAGRPLAVSSPNNSSSFGGGAGMRPNATGTPAALSGGPQICDNCLYFNPAAFTQTPQFAFGNVSRYLPDVNNPRTSNLDASIEKTNIITERFRLTFRAEAFNATNHVVFAGPTTSVTSSTFGRIILSQANTPRQIQFSLRLGF